MLAKWKEVFAWIPMESVVFEKRSKYYQALQDAQKTNDSSGFIEFTLSAIHETIMQQAKRESEHQVKHEDKHQVEALTGTMFEVMKILEVVPLSRKDIFDLFGMSEYRRFCV
jgi:Fic family protein